MARQLASRFYASLETPHQRRFAFRSPAVIERAQRRRVRRAVAHAYEHVPYYRETMRRLGLDPRDIRCAADLTRLPVLEREQLQRDPERFVSRVQPPADLVELRSSGSSGTPVVIYQDHASVVRDGAYQQRRYAVLAKLAGRRRLRQTLILPSEWAGTAAHRAVGGRLLPRALRPAIQALSLRDAPEVNLERLNAFRPDVLFSYGSYLEALFVYLRSSGVTFHRPRVVAYSSDAMSAGARRLIETDFGIPVVGFYGANEAFGIGFECEDHRGFHLNCDLYPIRLVDPEGKDVAEGESGEVVVSNRGTVLLNYRLGDTAALRPDGCPCGRNLPLLTLLEGRVGDWLVVPDGGRVNAQAVRAILSKDRDVWRYQVRQSSMDQVQVAIVSADDCDRHALRRRVAAGIGGLVGPDLEIGVTIVETLPRSPGGKVRSVVSLPSSADAAACVPAPCQPHEGSL